MGIAPSIDITTEQRKTILALLKRHLPDTEAWMYGSRIKWTSNPQSDLDMVVLSTPEQAHGVSSLREAFEDSNLPFRVDLFVWNDVPDSFRNEIEREHVVLTEPHICIENWRQMSFTEAVTVNPAVRLERGMKYPFVDMAAVISGTRCAHAVEQRIYSGSGSRFRDGDTLMARITPCLENGKIARYCADHPLANAHGSTEFIVIRGRSGVTESEYAYYLTHWKEVRNYAVDQMTGTSGRQRVPVDSLDSLSVAVPPLPEQRTIAHILGTLDDKIELNRRMNGTLEAMARAIFRDWFVDFGPIRAKAEGREPYLAPELWDLFPDALDDEGKPVGWSCCNLKTFAHTNPESWSKTSYPEEIEYVDLANTKWGTIEATQKIRRSDAPTRAKRVLRTGDTIVGLVRPGNGSYAFIGGSGLTGSTGFAALRPHKRSYSTLVYLSATAPDNIQRLAGLADGAAYPAIRPDFVEATEIAAPDDAVITRFSELMSPIFESMVHNTKANDTLAQTRDQLLPKLMSGKIRLAYGNAAAKAVKR